MIHLKHILLFFLISCSLAGYAQFRLYEKGHDSYKAGKYDESVKFLTEYLTKATRDKKIDIDVFYIRALSFYKQEKFADAIPDFEETLLRGHENKGNIYWFMAKCYDRLSQDEEAINAYDNAIRELTSNGPSRAKLLFERSQIHYRMKNIIQSYNDLKDGQLADAGNADIQKRLQQMEKENVADLRQAQSQHPNAPANKTVEKRKDATVADTKNATAEPTKTPVKSNAPEVSTVVKNEPGAGNRSENKQSGTKPAEVPITTVGETSTSAAPTLADLYKNEKRFALVIGNSNYPKNIGVLRNPKNDASDIAVELQASNFDVTLLTDATYGQIRAALMRFKEKLDGGDRENTVGLFYYAGHGVQFDDENYLVPVDATVEYEDDIPRYCFPINRMVLANMERSSTRMNIVILDACRNNPFPSLNRSLGDSGLGEMKRARGSFIAYATAPGSVASDGTGRNGLYTQELLKAMKKPGLTIEQVFKEVRMNVLKASGNKQNTWDSSNIVGEFHFKY